VEHVPERLEQAGVSWKITRISRRPGRGVLGWIDDGTRQLRRQLLLYFHSTQRHPGNRCTTRPDRHERQAVRPVRQLRKDVKGNKLRRSPGCRARGVHRAPNWPANYGAWYISRSSTPDSNPSLGQDRVLHHLRRERRFFDHACRPSADVRAQGLSTADVEPDLYPGSAGSSRCLRPGQRVRCWWSRLEHRCYVCSEVFDHTSIIRSWSAGSACTSRTSRPGAARSAAISHCVRLRHESTGRRLPTPRRTSRGQGASPGLRADAARVGSSRPGTRRTSYQAAPYRLRSTVLRRRAPEVRAHFQSGSRGRAVPGHSRTARTAMDLHHEAGKSLSDTWNTAGSHGLYDLTASAERLPA